MDPASSQRSKLIRAMKLLYFIAVIGLSISAPVSAEYLLSGSVFTSTGVSGTAATENSFGGLKAYRIGVAGQLGKQTNGEIPACDEKIFAADSGSGLPAYYLADVGNTDQWKDAPVAGQEAIAIIETYSGQFGSCAWNGAAYVGGKKAVISASDVFNKATSFGGIHLNAIPSPVTQAANYYDATLTWTGLANDPDNIITGYTVYRSLSAGSGYIALTYTASQNKGAVVTFVDSGLVTNTTYYYKIAVNYEWGGTGNTINTRYVTTAQSVTMSVKTKSANNTALSMFLDFAPASAVTISTGQQLQLIALFTNSSGEPVNNVNPVLGLDPGPQGVLTQLSNPGPRTVPNGVSYMTWTYSANSAGTVQFTAYAEGSGQSTSTLYIANVTDSNQITVRNAVSLTAQTAVIPVQASTSQWFRVVMTVTNSGEAQSNNTVPFITPMGDTGSIALISSPASPVIISGGNSRSFTWTYSASSPGTLSFSCYAEGTDQYSSAVKRSNYTLNQNIIIQNKAVLSAAFYAPNNVSINQVFTVRLRVTNGGQAASAGTAPVITRTGTGTVSVVSGPLPVSASIGGMSYQEYTWTYSATAAGSLNFEVSASGTDANSGLTVSSNVINKGITIQTRPSLSASMSVSPLQVSTGQDITVIMSVNNSGEADANNVSPVPALPGLSGTGAVSLVSGPQPSSYGYILGGNSSSFTWIFSADGPGNIAFSSRAAGIDANEMSGVTSNAASTASVTIQTAAALVSSVTVSQSQISTGNILTVRLSVTNSGGANINNAAPQMIVSGTGSYTLLTGPLPANFSLAGGGGYNVFTWTYLMEGSGNVNFQARANGEDENSGVIVVSSYNNKNVTVQQAAALESLISVIPLNSANSWPVTVVMTVANSGEAQADAVAPSLIISPESSGSMNIVSVPSPASASIAGGAMAGFTWVYTAGSTGSVVFSGRATGNDANNGTAIASEYSHETAYVQTPASLSSDVHVLPVSISSGQVFTVLMYVTNTGIAAADSVVPSALTKFGTAGAVIASGPLPSSASIPGGQTQVFTWTYNAATTGSLAFRGNASGNDSLTGSPVSSAATTSLYRTVINGSALSASIFVSPASVNMDTIVTVRMTVTNTGGAQCNNVSISPAGLAIIGTGGVLSVAVPSPSSVNIAGSASHVFTWTFSAVGTGTVIFSARAQGTDSNSAQPVYSSNVLSNNLVIETKAILEAQASVSPLNVNIGQEITLYLTVTNTGLGQANGVTPNLPGINGTASVSQTGPSVPVSADIPSGGSQVFTFRFSPSTTGNASFTVSAYGTDFNSGARVDSNGTTTGAVVVQTASNLIASAKAINSGANVGQQITVTFSVTNTGQASC